MSDKQVMTDEVKAKLAGLLPCSSEFTVNVTPECYNEIPEEFRPVFKLKPLNNKQLSDISKNINEITKNEERAILIVKKQLVGWTNIIKLDDESQVEFETDEDGSVKRSLWDIIPRSVQASLVGSLLQISGLKTA